MGYMSLLGCGKPPLVTINVGFSGTSSRTGTASTAHTVGSGTNRLLLVAIIGGGLTAISGVTFGGVSLSEKTGGTGQIFYLINPSSGLGTVALTVNNGGIHGYIITDWTGVHQTTPLSDIVNGTGGGTSFPSLTPSGGVSGDMRIYTGMTPDDQDVLSAVNGTLTGDQVGSTSTGGIGAMSRNSSHTADVKLNGLNSSVSSYGWAFFIKHA